MLAAESMKGRTGPGAGLVELDSGRTRSEPEKEGEAEVEDDEEDEDEDEVVPVYGTVGGRVADEDMVVCVEFRRPAVFAGVLDFDFDVDVVVFISRFEARARQKPSDRRASLFWRELAGHVLASGGVRVCFSGGEPRCFILGGPAGFRDMDWARPGSGSGPQEKPRRAGTWG